MEYMQGPIYGLSGVDLACERTGGQAGLCALLCTEEAGRAACFGLSQPANVDGESR